MSFFNKDHHDFHWLAGMLSGAGLLVVAAVFVSSGGLSYASSQFLGVEISPASQTASWGCGIPGIGCSGGSSSPQGSFDGADCNVANGWARDTDNTIVAIWVTLYDGGTAVADYYAADYRPDLIGAGIYPYHGFSIPIPQSVKNGASHRLAVIAHNAQGTGGGDTVLSQVHFITCGTPPAPVCSNGLNINSYPSCTCPAGQGQSDASCVPLTCSNGLAYGSYGPSCTCPSGQIQSGASCITPGQPTAGITADSQNIKVGESTDIHATFAAGQNDSLTGTNIDSPEGTGLASNTNPGPKDITFRPTVPGTYTFYARVATAHYGWQSKATIQVNVSAMPVPGVPQGLSATCSQAGTSVDTSWGSVAGADHYWTGLDDTANNSGSCQSGWMCATPPDYTNNWNVTSHTYPVAPSHAMRLMVASCNSVNGCSAANEMAFTCTQPPPSLSITANNQTGLASIPINTPINIAWQTSNVQANSCHTSNNSGDGAIWLGDSGSKDIGALAATRIYSLNCTSLSGAPASATVTIDVQGASIDGALTARPARVQAGTQTHLSWHTVGMISCNVKSSITGTISSSLASSDTPAAVPHASTFTLTCQDGANSFTQSVDVGVIPSVQEI